MHVSVMWSHIWESEKPTLQEFCAKILFRDCWLYCLWPLSFWKFVLADYHLAKYKCHWFNDWVTVLSTIFPIVSQPGNWWFIFVSCNYYFVILNCFCSMQSPSLVSKTHRVRKTLGSCYFLCSNSSTYWISLVWAYVIYSRIK